MDDVGDDYVNVNDLIGDKDIDEVLNKNITEEEIGKAIKLLKNGNGCGIDGL